MSEYSCESVQRIYTCRETYVITDRFMNIVWRLGLHSELDIYESE